MKWWYEPAKRILDIAFALLGIAISGPLMICVAIAIKLDSKGPVLYRGTRVGRHGVLFHMLKFRTMVPDAERRGGSCTANDDDRITRFGKLLRRLKLDELPQLFNVLAGNMSLVGPRPEVKTFTDMFTAEERSILEIKPGITDWATIWDSDEGSMLEGSADPEGTYFEQIRPTKIKLQLDYVRRRSLKTDLLILAQTVLLVVARFRPGGAKLALPR